MIRTCVVGIWESRKQMRSGWQRKPQSKIHTGERSGGGGENWVMGVISLEPTDSGGRRTPWEEAEQLRDCRGQELASSTGSDSLGQILPLFPTKRRQAVVTADLSLEHTDWTLGQKKAGWWNPAERGSIPEKMSCPAYPPSPCSYQIWSRANRDVSTGRCSMLLRGISEMETERMDAEKKSQIVERVMLKL